MDEPDLPPHVLRGVRAIEVLERIGTKEAKQVLQTAAKGAPGARLTEEAKASLDRAMSMPMGAGAWATGPGVVTHVLSQRDDVEVLPPSVFYPYAWTEPWRETEDFSVSSALAVHHYSSREISVFFVERILGQSELISTEILSTIARSRSCSEVELSKDRDGG